MSEIVGTPCAAVDCPFVFAPRSRPAKKAGGERRVEIKRVHSDHLIILGPNSKVGDPLCNSCAAKDARMRSVAASPDCVSAAREVARITTERQSLSFSTVRPPAASTRSAQKAVDKLKVLTTAATNTSFISPTRMFD
jgi:hypothetical protein